MRTGADMEGLECDSRRYRERRRTMTLYPPKPRGVDVFWDNGKFVAIVDDHGTRRNVARHNAQTRRDAILGAREYLDMETLKYDDA